MVLTICTQTLYTVLMKTFVGMAFWHIVSSSKTLLVHFFSVIPISLILDFSSGAVPLPALNIERHKRQIKAGKNLAVTTVRSEHGVS